MQGATAANGFYVMVHVYVEPKFIDPPKFTETAGCRQLRCDGKVRVQYALDLGGREDQSLITWSQCDDAPAPIRARLRSAAAISH